MNNETSAAQQESTGPSLQAGEMIEQVYSELRRLAAYKMSGEAPGHTLQSTALLHEAWLRVSEDPNRRFASRTHFLAAAAEAMRRILIDRARRRRAARHGGDCKRVVMEQEILANPADDEELIALGDALEQFEAKYPTHAQVVKLRYFAGMTNEEISEVIGTSVSTVKNYWAFSKAWLFDAIKKK